MKFIHMADMHLDSQFVTLANYPNKAQERRLEQLEAMNKIVEYIQKNNIPYFFISGDLYENEYIRKSTIEHINHLFSTIPNTKIFITPGNHDPYINNSFYKQFKWAENVHIFTGKLEKVEFENIDIYGYGFDDFYMVNKYPNIKIDNPNKINILIIHGNLDTGFDDIKPYNPLKSKDLKGSNFDYVALGHIHKKSYNDYENQKIVYPGSTVSLGFDELGERGFIEGEITEDSKKLNLKFIKTSAKTFEEKEIDVTNISSPEQLIQVIKSLNLDTNYYKIILTGKRNFEIDEKSILDLLSSTNIIKIKNNTAIKYDIEEIAKQISLKGIFAKKILEKISELGGIKSEEPDGETKEEKNEQIENLLEAFEVGMDILNKN